MVIVDVDDVARVTDIAANQQHLETREQHIIKVQGRLLLTPSWLLWTLVRPSRE
jgi:hypothetical protein